MSDIIPKKVIIDTATGQVTEEDMTPEELAELELAAIEAAKNREIEEAAAAAKEALKASAKAKLIAGQALSPEEAELLLQ
jgi:hypothetical protein